MQPKHALIGSPVTLIAAAVVFAAAGAAAGWIWSDQFAQNVTNEAVLVPRLLTVPATATATGIAPAAVAEASITSMPPNGSLAPVGPGPISEDAPANILLVGTHSDGPNSAATFLVDGQLHTVALGAHVGSSVLVLAQITPQSALLGLPGGASAVEVKLRPAREIAQSLALERQAAGVAADLGVRSGAQSQPQQRRGAGQGSGDQTADMVLSVPRRERQKPGPVGSF